MSDVQGKVLKHGGQTRSMHWMHLLAFLILGLTGIGFYWDIGVISNLFGGPANASLVHRWTGVVFTVGPALYIFLNFDRFSRFIDTISHITKEDMGWLKVMGGYLPFIKVDQVPPPDKYNAGQKMLGWMIILGCLLMILTGFPMWVWRHDLPPVFLSLCYNVHFWTAIVLILLVGGHFFLAAIHPKSRVEFGSMMLDGYIDAGISEHHNAKWYAELKQVE
ncbi:MAG TPA: cytochrome b/b6 domain-containing protein [Syntrophomonadaceae bacterium]|nr:cytochrome b/b6 domain-containing protein [Syntrophomonadaceae bacterium]